MAEFKCNPGYCVKCCTDVESIPVTLGDLYRAWFLRKKTGEGTSFHNVFRELCNDWTAVPSTKRGYIYASPNSKIPCRNLDMEAKDCSVYGIAKYIGCTLSPEEMLLPDIYGLDSKKTKEFFASLECLKGVILTEGRKKELARLRDLMDREIGVTVETLQSRIFPNSVIRGKPSKRVQRELFERIRYISNYRENMKKLRENLVRNGILQDYEKLVMTEDPGFSYCEEI